MSQFGSVPPGSAQVCGRCEALLMDVLDGVASPEEQAFFDGHVGSCTGCSQMLADARRGGAWLEMLRDPRPEPSAALFERILAQTSGLAGSDLSSGVVEIGAGHAGFVGLPGTAAGQFPARVDPAQGVFAGPAYGLAGTDPRTYGSGLKVLPFRVRGALHGLGQTMLQPRLAMTAAMAFFSIALTLNLTGVHLNELRLKDLRPATLRRDFYEANAHVVRYCDNLRVVYELEARAHDLQRSSDGDSSPTTRDDGQTASPRDPKSDEQPGNKPATPKPGPGTSRKESLTRDERFAVALLNNSVARSLHGMQSKGDPA